MQTELPGPAARAAAARRLSWPDIARLLTSLGQVWLLNLHLNALYRSAGLRQRPPHGGLLLRLMRRWLRLHEAIGRLLPGIAEPEHVREVRAILIGSDRPRASVDQMRRAPKLHRGSARPRTLSRDQHSREQTAVWSGPEPPTDVPMAIPALDTPQRTGDGPAKASEHPASACGRWGQRARGGP